MPVAAENSFDELFTQINTLESSISTLQTDLAAQAKVTRDTLEAMVARDDQLAERDSVLQNEVAELRSTAKELTTRVTTLETSSSSLPDPEPDPDPEPRVVGLLGPLRTVKDLNNGRVMLEFNWRTGLTDADKTQFIQQLNSAREVWLYERS